MVRNPVRAYLVRAPGQWRWSSYRASIGQADAPMWLATDWLLAQFARPRKRAIAHYQAFVRQGVGEPSIWDHLNQQIFLCDAAFVRKMQQRLNADVDLSEVPTA